MAVSPTADWFEELGARGRLAPGSAPVPLPPGNQDRRPELARRSWRVQLADGRPAKLTLGPSLDLLAGRSAALAAACPGIAAAPLFRETLAHGEVLAEAFFDGVSVDDAVRAGTPPADALRRAIAAAAAALAATEEPSTNEARAAEWRTWAGEICALPVWTAAERALLDQAILPALERSLAAAPAVTRWTNGDLLASNLLVAPDGRVCLVDAEYAARTHFFREDSVRFRILSGPARLAPHLIDDVLPEAGLDWHLFFWLRQLGLEIAQNTPAYVARVLPRRRATVRRLAEHLFGLALTDWSVPAVEVFHHIEEAGWKPTPTQALRLAGWCHVPSARAVSSVAVLTGNRRLAEADLFPRPDVQAHFAGDPRALNAGFSLALPRVAEDARLAVAAICDDGTWLPFAALRAGDLPVRGPLILDYPAWAAQHDPDPPAGSTPPLPPAAIASGPVKFSILLPVFDTPERLLRECVESVRRQHYPHWELVIVDDPSAGSPTRPLLESLTAGDPRMHTHFRAEHGGISRATNDALAAAANPFVVLLDHDDRLRPHALAELARWIAADPAADVLYSDEEKISLEGARVWPQFKPAFSPQFLLGVMYPGHLLCVRAAVARAAGGFDPAYDGIQDYEFFLRLTEHTQHIRHVPRVLYQWRLAAASSALAGNIKGDMDQRQAEAVRAHLARRHRAGRVAPIGGHRLRLTAEPAADLPTVSVVAAGGADGPGGPPDLETLFEAGGARILEVLTDGKTDLPPADRLRRLAGQATGDILLFLTCRPARPAPGWLAPLVAAAALDDAGAVAPVLLSAGGAVLEAGWTVGLGAAAPLMRRFDASGDGYNGSLACDREVSAVSGLCLAVRRDRYEKVGGLRPALGAPWWALDLSLRLAAAGWRNRTAAVRLPTDVPETFQEDFAGGFPGFAQPWADRLARPDPYLNIHFDPAAGDYRLASRSLWQAGPGTIPRPALRFHLDAPGNFALPGRFLRMHGWGFAPGLRLQGVRLSLPSMKIFGLYGTARPDVSAALPEAPGVQVGFELWARMPPGHHQAALQFQDEAGAWHDAASLALHVPRWTRSAWLPAGRPADLVAFQLGLGPAHAPRPVTPERFPALRQPAGARPRLAIVTPSLNHAAFLAETVASVAAAGDVAVSHVVQDGGSTDGSVELLRQCAAAAGRSPPLVWASATDRGQADAIAKGFAQTAGAAGDLMAWINSDDYYLPGALAYVTDYFARHPGVDVLYGNRVVVDERSQEIARWFLPAHDDAVLRLNDFVPQETLFWRRRVWDRVGGVDPTLNFAVDWDLLLRFQAAGARIVHVPYFLACFRVHAAQKTSAQLKGIGQEEIDRLRARTFGRRLPFAEIETHPRLLAYLRRSAWIEFGARFGVRL